MLCFTRMHDLKSSCKAQDASQEIAGFEQRCNNNGLNFRTVINLSSFFSKFSEDELNRVQNV